MAASAHSGRKQRRMVSLRRRDLSGQRDRYGMRLHNRAALRRAYSFEFSFFTQFARNRPAQEPEHPGGDSASGMGTSNVDEEGDRIAILGVSAQATISEVKNAYKVLIRQNHPDRVQDMSLALRTLAEAETKKINAAYRQALLYVLPEVEAAE
jgi:DnaJ-domain-containing protein 1